MQLKKSKSLGFTLLEILLVVGIIAVLAGIVIIAINPSKQLATVRNTQRKSNLAEINKAVQQYYIDHGTYPGSTTLVSTLTEICNTGAVSATSTSVTGDSCGTLVNLSDLVPTYLVAIPVDPQGSPVAILMNIAYAADTIGTGYQVMKDANNKIALKAMGAEQGAVITVGPVVVVATSTLGDGLVVHYTMNDVGATTTIIDNIGTYNAVSSRTASVMTTSGAKTNTGTAISFNGNDEVYSSEILNLGATWSIGLWVKLAPQHAYFGILASTAHIGSLDNDGNAAIFNGSSFVKSTGIVGDTVNWHYVTYTHDSGEIKIYVDGLYDSTYSGTLSSSGPIYLGHNGGGEAKYTGTIDDFRVYNRVLTQEEITLLAAGTEAE